MDNDKGRGGHSKGERQEAVEIEILDDGSGKWLAKKGRRAQDSEGEVESP